LKFGSDPSGGGHAESRLSIDLMGRGAGMMLEVETFQYIVKDEAGATLGGYNSTDEPPAKGDVIRLHNILNWDFAEIVGVTMILSKHYNTVVLKVRPVNTPRLLNQ
jgi:hypothetical protein